MTELSAQGSPAPQHGPEVYVLPLTKVSLPMAKQPGRSGKPGCGRTPACCTWGSLITGHGVMGGCWGPWGVLQGPPVQGSLVPVSRHSLECPSAGEQHRGGTGHGHPQR